ncbi:structural protein [Acheta domestica mini ambidensovirus]|uniref:Structural protein n=1 Tax=Acheta domestica mini ambidensovirus TaxID=1404345 RepID=V5KE12_9VIRU|nr:structural protein [Acheta domestica mini ambidensovirus]AGW50718.1 structural protein [Acheta domestica mini ambidensovirus]
MAPVLVVPGHKYLGPGNKLHSGKPVNSADKIAQRHDWFYNFDRTASEVRNSDFNAIREFWQNWQKTGEIDNLVGAAGLGAKYVAESVVGVQYPQMSTPSSSVKTPQKRLRVTTPKDWARIRKINQANRLKRLRLAAEAAGDRQEASHEPSSNPEPGPSVERPPSTNQQQDHFQAFDLIDNDLNRILDEVDAAENMNNEEEWENMDEDLADQDIGSATARTGGVTPGTSGQLPRAETHDITLYKTPFTPARRKVFYNDFTWQLWGNSFCDTISTAGTSPVRANTARLFSLGYIPWEQVSMYMSPAEFLSLAPDARIVKVGIRATIRGFTTSFETNSALTGIASSHHWIQGLKAVGLNNKFHIRPRIPEYAANSLRVTKSNEYFGSELEDILWGSNALQTEAGGYPCIQKCPRDLPCYTEILGYGDKTDLAVPNVQQFQLPSWGRVDVRKDITDFSAAPMVDKVILSEVYSPQDGTLFFSPVQGSDDVKSLNETYHGGTLSTCNNIDFNVDANGNYVHNINSHTVNINETSNRARNQTLLNSLYRTIIEKTSCHSSLNQHPHMSKVQPSVHLGIMPVYPNTPGYSTSTNPVNVCMYVKFQTFCIVEETTGNSLFPYANVRPQLKEKGYDGRPTTDFYYASYSQWNLTSHERPTSTGTDLSSKNKGERKKDRGNPYVLNTLKQTL